ncbi:MAG: LPS translocon maturation chaperone LptM [Steroidobacteraceae bacterium]
MRTLHVFIVASLAGTVLACGQKGPLVLPDAQHPHKKIGIGKPPAPPVSAPTDATATGEAQTRPTPAPQP